MILICHQASKQNFIEVDELIDLKMRNFVRFFSAYGTKYSLQKFLELNPEELMRPGLLLKPDADMAFQCISKAFYPFSRRQTSGLFERERENQLVFNPIYFSLANG